MTRRRSKAPGETFTADEIAARLQAGLPAWSFDGSHLRRRYRTAGWKGTLMVVNAIGHLAEVAWHHPDLSVSYDQVGVGLQTHDADGITEKDFALAAKIEELLTWQPGRESEPVFDGTPDDPRHHYIRHDR